MKFSLVLATVNRTRELASFLESLARQTYRDFELIIVDQNLDNRLIPICRAYQEKFPIIHLRSEAGLSRARNVGLYHATGEVIAFPDDDCIYPRDLLERVAGFLSVHPAVDGITGCAVRNDGRPCCGRWDRQSGFLNRWNVWIRGISITLFLRRKVIEDIGYFDESLGVGANTPWGSGEETDLLLRALSRGYSVFYDPTLKVIHPDKMLDASTVVRARSYGRGMGRVMRKHGYPIWYWFYYLLRPLGGAILAIIMGRFRKASYHWETLLGRYEGYCIREK